MNGKHSLTASVVAFVGPDGPRYYPESLSSVGAETLAESLRSTGRAAVDVPVHLRLPDAGEMLRAPREQLFGVVRDDPFDYIESELFDESRAQADREEAAAEVDDECVETATDVKNSLQPAADDSAARLERIHGALGRLALLECSASQSRDDEQRLRIFREMHAAALPLACELEPLCRDAEDDDAEEPEAEADDDSDGPYQGNSIARGFAIRVLGSPEVGCGWWGHRLISPGLNVRKLVSKLAENGMKARAYDVAVDLDSGTVKVTPLPWWNIPAVVSEQDDEAEQDYEVEEEADQLAGGALPEPLGDASTFIGDVSFERSLDQWTVWVVFIDHLSPPQLVKACDTLDDAWAEAKRWRDDPEHRDWGAILVGPGDGPVHVPRLIVWPDRWSVLAGDADGQGIGCDGYPELEHQARRSAECKVDRCPIITAAYRPERKEGLR